VFNFHPTHSFTDYRIGVPFSGTYRIVLDTDERKFGGFDQIDHHIDYYSFEEECGGRPHSILVYAPSRTAFALALVEGTRVEGTRMEGTRMEGTRMEGTRMEGTRMEGTRMEGTRMEGTRMEGIRMEGTRMEGMP